MVIVQAVSMVSDGIQYSWRKSMDNYQKLFDGDELDDLFSDVIQQESGTDLGDRSMGGFENMTEEEIEQFQSSSDFQNYQVKVQVEKEHEANMYGKTVEEIMGLSNIENPYEKKYNSIDCIDVDFDQYYDMYAQSPIMQENVKEGEKILPTFKYLHMDIFLSLVKYKPAIVPKNRLHSSVLLNRGILESLVNTPEYIALRKTCRLDEFNAAIGTEILGKKAMEILKEALEQLDDYKKKKEALDRLLEEEQKMDELADEMFEIDEMIEQLKQQGGSQAQIDQLIESKDSIGLSLEQASKLAEAYAKDCDELIDESSVASDQVTKYITNNVSDAINEVSEVREIIDAFGFGEGDNSRISFKSKKDAVETIRRSDKVKRMVKAIGRAKETAIAEQKKKAKTGAVEIKSVSVGSKIENTLPSDRMNLIHDATKKDFYRRMSENQLLVYDKESNKEKNKGPIIVCVDTSGSMGNSEEIWSKAMAVSVLEIAQMQKRDYACIIYSGSADDPIIIKKNEVDAEKIISVAETYHGGGTDFESPLRKSMDLINDSTFKEADILFITDGECSISDQFAKTFNRTKEEKDFRCLGILIDLGGGRTSDASLKKFCDNITRISSLKDIEDTASNVNRAIFGTL